MVLQIYQRRHKKNSMAIASKRRRINDPISNLPEDAIKTIFTYLPIRDAVRSSILSKIWRYRWAKHVPELILEGPRLTLDESMRKTFKYTKNNAQSMVSLILCQLMLHHEGPIKKFTLADDRLGPCSEIDSLIFFLLRNGLEDLNIDIFHYKLPLSLFKYQELRELNLTYGILEPAPAFKGFSRLSTLRLYDVTISNQVLNGLITGSPLLKLLDLKFSKPCQDVEIEIDAPNLKRFSFAGHANLFFFKNVPLLAQVVINARIHGNSEMKKCNLAEFFHCLPALQDLHIGGSQFLTFLAAVEVPTRLHNASLHVKDLTLENVVLINLRYLSLIFCLIRSSPNLNYINIKFLNVTPFTSDKVLEFFEEQENTGLILNQLEKVILNDVTGENYQLELIQLLLANSPNLKYMIIYNDSYQSSAQALNIIKQVKKSQRATNNGRVFFGFMHTKQVLTIGRYRGLARTKNGRHYIEFEI